MMLDALGSGWSLTCLWPGTWSSCVYGTARVMPPLPDAVRIVATWLVGGFEVAMVAGAVALCVKLWRQ